MNSNQFQFYISSLVDKWYASDYINLDYDANESVIPPDTFYCTGCHIRKDLKLLSKSNSKNKRCITCQNLRVARRH